MEHSLPIETAREHELETHFQTRRFEDCIVDEYAATSETHSIS